MRLKDKIILITGSATGIGKAIATRCVAEGAKVVIHGIDQPAADATAATLPKGTAVAIGADLTEPESPKKIVDFAIARYGALHGLVNNAAWIPRTNLFTSDVAMFDRCMAINVRAPMFLIQQAFPHLKKTKGAVLNIGSVNAYSGEGNLLPYSISKGALMVLTRNLADALGVDGVRVNQVNPGWIHSDAEQAIQSKIQHDDKWYEHIPKAFAPSGRILRPEEVAHIAVYWLSDESAIISGTVMELEQFPIIGRNPMKER